MVLQPGDTISYRVNFLEMDTCPKFDWPVSQSKDDTLIIEAQNPPAHYFFSLYEAVGSEYEWTDMYKVSKSQLNRFLSHKNVHFFSLVFKGWPGGFFILDNRRSDECDLTYFGLVPEATGQGLGSYLLKFAVKKAWDFENVKKLTVNTNTLDHPLAFPLYKKVGFRLIRTIKDSRILSKPRFGKC